MTADRIAIAGRLAEANSPAIASITAHNAINPAIASVRPQGFRSASPHIAPADTPSHTTGQMTDCWPMIAPGKPHDQMLGTYETLKKEGGVPQYRHAEPDEEAKLSLG